MTSKRSTAKHAPRAAAPQEPARETIQPAVGPNPDGLIQQAEIAQLSDETARKARIAELEAANADRQE